MHVTAVKQPSVKSPSKQKPSAFERFAAIVRKHGGLVCPNGRPTVLGIRKRDAASPGVYRDLIVVLKPNHKVQVFKGSTVPAQFSSSLSPDVNGDRQGDVAMIRPGNYVVVPNGPHHGVPSYHVLTRKGSDRVAAWRDTNHDGRISDAEKLAARKRGTTAGSILFHVGRSYGPSSIGCQNIPPAQYARFVKALGGPNARFNYTLVG